MTSQGFKKSLRSKARVLLNNFPERLNDLEKKEVQDLIEELNVHQIELEIQNEELMVAQKNLEDSRQRYTGLFDNAPVGYVILDAVGLVIQFNTTFTKMIPESVLNKTGLAFADLLVQEDGDKFRARYRTLFKAPIGKQIEAQLKGSGSQKRSVLIEAKHIRHSNQDKKTHSELIVSITDISDLQRTKQNLNTALSDAKEKEKEIAALLKGAHAVLEQQDFETTARTLFSGCSQIVGASAGYIALLSKDGKENELLFLEDGGIPCTFNPDLPMPIRGLRQEAYETGKVAYENCFMDSQWKTYLPKGHVPLENVMFAPLIIKEKVVGVMGLANKLSDFTENDVRIARGFGELAAIALNDSQLEKKRDLAEKQRENLITELQSALANIKKLSGLLPICSFCKKIRDDEGYWNQLEDYIAENSEAKLSHGICQECAKQHYPELDLYED